MKTRRAKTTIARLTIGYVRVSTQDQAANGASLDTQRAKIEAFALATDRTVDEIIVDDGRSASSLDRPGMGRILAGLRDGSVATVIVAKLDRLTRSTRDLGELLDLFVKANGELVSIGESLDTSTAAGRMVVNMLGVVAQWEREAIGERTAGVLAHKRASRIVYGNTPFGFDRDGDRLVENAQEQAALAEAMRMDAAGASFREIGRMLTDRGARPKRGKAWYACSVRAMLRSRIAQESPLAA